MKKDLQDYHVQQEKNESAFFEVLKTLNAELFVLIKMIMDEKLNIPVFFKLARHLINIHAGTGYGDVHIEIKDKSIIFINGTEKDKVDQFIKHS